jgi:hypothetical protein
MPEFVERHGEHLGWKRSVLDRALVLDEIDTSPDVLARPVRAPIPAMPEPAIDQGVSR